MKALVALIIALACARGAGADPARDAFDAGVDAYRDGHYAPAAAAFEEAFRLDPRAEIAFSLAQAHRNQYFVDHDITHLHRALGLYRHYLAEEPTGRRAVHARLHLESIETILASLPDVAPAPAAHPPTQLLVTSDAPGATASIDGDVSAPVPRVAEVAEGKHVVHLEAEGHEPATLDALALAERLVVVPAHLVERDGELIVRAGDARVEVDGRSIFGGSARVPAGEHTVVITARGHRSVLRSVEIAAGKTATVAVTLEPTPQRRAASATLLGAAGLAAIALVAGGLAWHAQSEAIGLEPHNASSDRERISYNDAIDRRDTYRGLAIGLAITSAAACATGAGLWWLDTPGPPERAAVRPIVGPETVGVSLSARF